LREVTVLEKIYRNTREAKASLAKMVEELLELDASVASVSRDKRDWAAIGLEGPDEEVAAKYIGSRLGTVTGLDELVEGQIRRGKIIDLGKVGYGIYVDVGAFDSSGSPVDALIPAFSLKRSLGVEGSIGVKRIVGLLGLMDYLPMDTRIVKVDLARSEILGRLTVSQARRLERRQNRFYVCGETRGRIKNAIERTGNTDKILRVKRLGLLECEVDCRKGVNPHDLLRQVGPMLNAQVTVPRGL